jgi:hypothetical protein
VVLISFREIFGVLDFRLLQQYRHVCDMPTAPRLSEDLRQFVCS